MNNILVIIDKIELKYFEFNQLVTNFWFIKEFLNREKNVYITTTNLLSLKGDCAYTKCYECFTDKDNIFYKSNLLEKEIDSFELVLFRPDPPVDIDYINATYIFDFVKTRVINSPSAIRNFNEKLHSIFFKEFMTDTMISCNMNDIESFLAKYKQIVIKPLNRCFGSGVMYLYEGDPNTRTIINTLTNNETTQVMLQEFLPSVKSGDTRVLTCGDKILPYCIKKLPGNNDFKFNTHNDDFIVKSELTKQELEYFTPIAKKLDSMGIKMAGLDVIGDKIIEINVTSPCYFIKEINRIYGIHLEQVLVNYMLTSSLLSL